jgi:hypothetical protein
MSGTDLSADDRGPRGHRRGWRALLACTLLLTAGACTGRQPDTRPDAGTLTVGVSSDGPGVESLTLRLVVDGTRHDVRADGGLVTVRNLRPGDVSARVEDLPAGCAVEGGPARTLVIRPGRTTAARLVVHCRRLPEPPLF